MHIEELYKLFKANPSVITDTRKIKAGDIFFALKGPNFNGNHYTKQALEKGASWCITDESTDSTSKKVIKVDNALHTLQQLAKLHRQQFDIPFIAITGSNGKTTTKELIHAVLSSKYKTYTTEGNLNNHIGIPITLLKIRPDAEMAVIEMGANHQGEIKEYCTYTLPTHGLITNVGKAHIEGFGSEEGVRKAKGELFDHLRENQRTAFVYNGQDSLTEMSRGIQNIITYGYEKADHTGKIKSDDTFLEVVMANGTEVNTKLVGGYNLPNIIAAICVGRSFNIPEKDIKTSLENYVPSNSRSQLIEKGGNMIILDAYNANPSSMKAAILNFSKMQGNNKILILGAMMEMGAQSEQEHKDLVQLISEYKWDTVVLVGKNFENMSSEALYFNNSAEVKEWYAKQHFKEMQILIKGSRSLQMEKVIED